MHEWYMPVCFGWTGGGQSNHSILGPQVSISTHNPWSSTLEDLLSKLGSSASFLRLICFLKDISKHAYSLHMFDLPLLADVISSWACRKHDKAATHPEAKPHVTCTCTCTEPLPPPSTLLYCGLEDAPPPLWGGCSLPSPTKLWVPSQLPLQVPETMYELSFLSLQLLLPPSGTYLLAGTHSKFLSFFFFCLL